MSAANSINSQDIEASLAWWKSAGVDYVFDDDVTVWLSPDQPDCESQPGASAEASNQQQPLSADANGFELPKISRAAAPDLLGEDAPQDLDSFKKWWLQAPGLDAIGLRGRIPPRGPANAKLMVLVVDPEQIDRDHLLSGPQGRLLSAILAAIGIPQAETYFASALPRYTPMADTQAAADSGLREVLLHHIDLAAPERIVAFGGNVLPLLGKNSSQTGKNLPEINSTASKTPMFVSEGLDSLMASPRLKARFWRRWIEWQAD